MRIGIIGATGKAGALIANEAYERGIDVTAIVRNKSKVDLDRYAVINKDIFSLTKKDVEHFDAVISAFGNDMGDEITLQTSLKHMTEVFEQVPAVRLLIVGGAASLYTDESETGYVLDMIPSEWRAVPQSMFIAFGELKKSKVNWTYQSPAYTFDPDGARTGRYTLGTDYLIKNRQGESYISYADFAVAMIDEVVKGQFIGRRYTAVSERVM